MHSHYYDHVKICSPLRENLYWWQNAHKLLNSYYSRVSHLGFTELYNRSLVERNSHMFFRFSRSEDSTAIPRQICKSIFSLAEDVAILGKKGVSEFYS